MFRLYNHCIYLKIYHIYTMYFQENATVKYAEDLMTLAKL